MKKQLLRFALLAALGSSLSANEKPSLHWNLQVYLNCGPFPQQTWYQPAQAIAHDNDNNLMQVQIDYLADVNNPTGWTAFAYNGVSQQDIANGNYYDIVSDANFVYQAQVPAATAPAHVFRARALDSAGAASDYIYLLVKPWGTSFTVDDLPTYALPSGVTNDGHVQKFFPNAFYHQMNSRVLAQVIDSLQGKNGYTIWFKDGIHEFDSSWARYPIHSWDPVDANGFNTWYGVNHSADEAAKVEVVGGEYWYNPGGLAGIRGCANVTFQAVNRRAAVLKWASYSRSGSHSHLVSPSASQLFTPSDATLPQDWYTRSRGLYYGVMDGPRPWPLPGPFLTIADNCAAIRLEGLAFDTGYFVDPYRVNQGDAGRADNGRHLEIFGSNTTVNDCAFGHAPGWSVVVGSFGGTAPTDVHINASDFYATSGDGLNIQNGKSTWVVGNTFSTTGDDAISVAGENQHVIYNTIYGSGWRGVLAYNLTSNPAIYGGQISEISFNQIHYTAAEGISISPNEAEHPTTYTSSSNVQVYNNTMTNIGWFPDHNTNHAGSNRVAIATSDHASAISTANNTEDGAAYTGSNY